jgi:SAM-dependent methyltransferase
MFGKVVKIIRKSPFRKSVLAFVLWINYRSYFWIKKLIAAPGESHPKHAIMNYHKFFLDNIDSKDKVLDIGCGTGEVASDLARKADLVVGVDIKKNHIEQARVKYRLNNLKFFESDASTLDLGALGVDRFNAVVLSNVLEHLEDRVSFLKGVAKIADKILLRVPMVDRDWLAVWRKENGFPYRLDPEHYIEYTRDSLATELSAAGWKMSSSSVQFGETWAVVIK